MRKPFRPEPGASGPGPAWGVVALAAGGGAALTSAVGGAAVGHPVAGLVIAGVVLALPWILIGVLVCTVARIAMSAKRPTVDTVKLIGEVRRVIEILLRR